MALGHHERSVDDLTAREADVLHLLALDLSYAEISQALHVSVNTVKSHVRHTYDKLGVTRRADAVRAAYGSEVVRNDGVVSLRLRLPDTSRLTSISFSEAQPLRSACDECGSTMERIVDSTYDFGGGTGLPDGTDHASTGGHDGDGGAWVRRSPDAEEWVRDERGTVVRIACSNAGCPTNAARTRNGHNGNGHNGHNGNGNGAHR